MDSLCVCVCLCVRIVGGGWGGGVIPCLLRLADRIGPVTPVGARNGCVVASSCVAQKPARMRVHTGIDGLLTGAVLCCLQLRGCPGPPSQCMLKDRESTYNAAYNAASFDAALSFEFENGMVSLPGS